ncbi:histidine triad protein D [Streptococcus pneumoniae]|nr:histidine triad protein D [Streptococcus pneumoniae]
MKINKKYLAGSVAVLALSVCSYELGRYQAGQDKKESNRVAYIDGDQAGQKAENLTPDEVSKREGINAEQIVIKITDQGYVTSHGDHYHYYNGKVLNQATVIYCQMFPFWGIMFLHLCAFPCVCGEQQV